MRIAAVAIAAGACGPTAKPRGTAAPAPPPSLVATIAGVDLARDVQVGIAYGWRRTASGAIHGGRLEVRDLRPGTWDLMVAGDGFARIAIPNVHIVAGRTTDAGTVHAARGHRIAGRVLGLHGVPAAGATVRLTLDDGHLDEAPLVALARGNQTARTDRDGAFAFDGVRRFVSLDTGFAFALSAELDHEVSPPLRLADADASHVTLALVPSGAVEGTVSGGREVGSIVELHGPTDTLAVVDAANTFHVAPLPTGTYTIGLAAHPLLEPLAPHTLVVAPGSRATAVELVIPDDARRAIVDAGRACTEMTLRTADIARPLHVPCIGSLATVSRIRPGHYRACTDGPDPACADIAVEPAPLEQHFRL